MIRFELLSLKKTHLRLDIIPFVILYSIILPLIILDEDEEYFIYLKFLLIVLLFINCLIYLIGNWNKYYSKLFHYNKILDISLSNYVYVSKKMKDGNDIIDICKLNKLENNNKTVTYIIFYKSKYIYDEDKRTFVKLEVNIPLKISSYYEEPVKLNKKELFDKNILDFPLPDFKQLFREQIMDPLNFFQLFTVCLYFFDEEFYHPLMTLAMLLFSNAMLVVDRMSVSMSIRNLRIKPQEIYIYRNNKWIKGNTHDLFPGDIVSIKPSSNIKELEDNSLEKDLIEIKKNIPFGNKLPPTFFDKIKNMGKGETKPVLPCDLIILQGSVLVDESILTGEAVPVAKEGLKVSNELLDLKVKNKNSLIFSGTEVLTYEEGESSGYFKLAPDHGAVCMVLRTGFGTSKGKLAKTILRNSDSATLRNKESYVLLFILLILSIISSVYVLVNGLDDEERDKNKLFVRCILIIVNVIPAELPMIISFAINSSLSFLKGKNIFCSEPFRIALCGKVRYMCFDKTGTLTSDKLEIEGFYHNNETGIIKELDNKEMTKIILSGCHSIVVYNGNIMGDPIELLFFENYKYKFNYSIKTTSNSLKNNEKIIIIKAFEFNSEYKRMSCIVKVEGYIDNNLNGIYVVCKGAPDMLEPFLVNKPEWYNKTQIKYSKQGYRLLTLCYKKLDFTNISSVKNLTREEAEKDLLFDSFYILTSKLKPDTKQYVTRFYNADYIIKMITGDSIYTAIQTYLELNITKNKQALYIKNEELYDYDDNKVDNLINFKKYIASHFICIEGKELNNLISLNKLSCELTANIEVFARVSPKHKEIIVNKLKTDNHLVLMCGDGSNDVGALKSSDVGIALIGTKAEKTKQEKKEELETKTKFKMDSLKKGKNLRQISEEMNDLFSDNVTFKAGDACVAAPFTNKHTNSIKCVQIIMKQGNCTMSTSMQNLKIITLNSFLNAYIMSTLHMDNLKFSDYQNTIMGIYALYFYYLLSFNTPAKLLPKDRPLNSIYNKYFIISVVIQIIINFGFLVIMQNLASMGIDIKPEDMKIDLETDETIFKPNFKVSVMFLYLLASNFCISIFNHEGRPFMKSIGENKTHKKLVLIPLILITCLCFNLSEELNYIFQTTFKTESKDMSLKLFAIIFIYILSNYALSLGIKYLRYKRIPSYL